MKMEMNRINLDTFGRTVEKAEKDPEKLRRTQNRLSRL
jgi:hypothetical protein